MGFFRKSADRRSQQSLPSTGHPGDDILLAQIAAQSDISAARHWVHYLYVKDEPLARSAAQVIAAAGWQIQSVDVAADGGTGWVVTAETHAATTPADVRDARIFFEGVAATHDHGDYDGWEASL